uniref:Uncharacterized protein n=1 Tax=Candidatus Methanogaster sp. ANME-2c ERB4 TaxID=2759911 RepID=A0A7G9Y822_9EURY|nr:hypothetical protein ELINAKEJ_00003 [Methanosarcinales archaeon ANME-2c ERB4]QNO44156.1 hypothetical protein MIPKNKFN_00003 [Methanosarcinales archaeon ANME-2c ERB4]
MHLYRITYSQVGSRYTPGVIFASIYYVPENTLHRPQRSLLVILAQNRPDMVRS